MRIAYFDCCAGISGNMILGALLDVGVDKEELATELSRLKVQGFAIKARKVKISGICATRVRVELKQKPSPPRRLRDILQLLERSRLDGEVKRASARVFAELAKVEAKIHSQREEEVLFHEVGALDAIVDIVGTFIGLRRLGIHTVYASRLPLGQGWIKCAHGILPVPSPATLALLQGVPVYSPGIDGELVTPTAAAILKSCCQGFGGLPGMRLSRIGYGAGDKRLTLPNLLRLWVGETEQEGGYIQEEALLLETNIDDMTPEMLSYVGEQLTRQGALDVYMRPIYMKKNRIGTMLSVLTREAELSRMLETIFSETSTLGIRVHRLQRYKLTRETVWVGTKFGPIKVKIASFGGECKNIAPEFESCRKAALKQGVPFQDVYGEAKRVAQIARETSLPEKSCL